MPSGLPVVLNLAGEHVILLGEGEAAAAKRRLLERAGALVMDESAAARFAWIAFAGEAADEATARLKARGILVNVADRPDLCDFTMPAIVDRDPLLVAVSTGGASAGLAAAVRQRIEAALPAGLGALATALRARRDALRRRFPDAADRRRAIAELLDREPDAAALDHWIEAAAPPISEHVTIRLRSSDPDELTLREARLLARADRVFHRPDVPRAILDRARADAARIACAEAPVEPGPGLSLDLEFRP